MGRTISTQLAQFFIITISLMLWSASAYAAQGWQVRVNSAVCVHSSQVRLGDIADPVGDIPSHIWNDLRTRVLWAAPERKGRPMSINRKKLNEALSYALGSEFVNTMILPSRFVMQRGGDIILREQLREKVEYYVRSRTRTMEGDISLREFRLPEYVFVPEASDAIEVTSASAMKPGSNNVQIQVVSSDRRILKRLSATVFLDAWRTVPCAAVPLNRKDLLTPNKIRFEKKNAAYTKGAWDGTGGPWRVTRTMGVGQVIATKNIELAPAIAKGDTVDLVYNHKNIHLTVKAEALEDGQAGEMITVRNLQSQRKVTGEVHNSDTVVIKRSKRSIK
ncbi:MAG: flagellar basal body P-ring formation chaperone FlgA [Desulfovibrio sp.]